MKKIIMYFLALWVLINVGLFIGSDNFLIKKNNDVFFPFGETIHYVYTEKSAIDIKDYDYTEFIAYALIIPAIVVIISFRKKIFNRFNNRINQIKSNKSTNLLNPLLESKNL